MATVKPKPGELVMTAQAAISKAVYNKCVAKVKKKHGTFKKPTNAVLLRMAMEALSKAKKL